jgi:predicted small lipoprotein YifL
MRQVFRRTLVVFALAILLNGCGPGKGPFPVEGKVVWEDDQPATELVNAIVIFDLPAEKTSARGNIQADGTFKLTTNKSDDGALAGDYKVLIIEVGRKSGGGPEGSNIAPGAMDSMYSDPSTTDLQVTVKPGTNPITLKLKRAGKPSSK